MLALARHFDEHAVGSEATLRVRKIIISYLEIKRPTGWRLRFASARRRYAPFEPGSNLPEIYQDKKTRHKVFFFYLGTPDRIGIQSAVQSNKK